MDGDTQPLVGESLTYDAFISYSHADVRLAGAIQSGLQRLGRPWYRRRPTISVFRDKAAFGASDDLSESLRLSLDESRYLVLLLSPESATSRWVDQEIAHWIASKDQGRLMPVVTRWGGDGAAAAPNLAGFRRAGEDVPESLRDFFTREPLAVDLRWVSVDSDHSMRNQRFIEALAEIASPILGTRGDRGACHAHRHLRDGVWSWPLWLRLSDLRDAHTGRGDLRLWEVGLVNRDDEDSTRAYGASSQGLIIGREVR